ncbi:MAG: Matrixin [uncultured Solirubrobacteraceae bacterium]|uniref:Matrixin n=1 Tax=uncultured Solirubrobacteraceae bacterium TaxID=1162706 RepID=A0A6J4SQE0_9ACTN|nr:MAG: Matrixin [uncultured Solirubrobacteraceae bacterium]
MISSGRTWNDAGGSLFFRAHRSPSLPTIARVPDSNPDNTFGSKPAPGDCKRTVGTDPEPVGIVKWVKGDGRGGTLARAGACEGTNAEGKVYTLTSFTMEVDRDENWFYRKRGKPKSTQVDMRSVVAHEFGHATGWGPHLDDAKPKSYCPTNLPNSKLLDPGTVGRFNQLMCKTYPRGTAFVRAPRTRDKRVFRSAYPR